MKERWAVSYSSKASREELSPFSYQKSSCLRINSYMHLLHDKRAVWTTTVLLTTQERMQSERRNCSQQKLLTNYDSFTSRLFLGIFIYIRFLRFLQSIHKERFNRWNTELLIESDNDELIKTNRNQSSLFCNSLKWWISVSVYLSGKFSV